MRGMPIPRYPNLRMGLPSKRALVQMWAVHRPDVVHIATEGPLGWSAVVDTPRPGLVAVQMKDRAGQPLTTLSVTGTLERPATEAGRQVLDFKPVGNGWYEARATLDGAWDLRAVARNAHDQFEVETRLVAP